MYFINCYGADLKEKTGALDSYARMFREFVSCGEKQLHIAVICGSCVGGSAYLAGMCDVILFSEGRGNLCLTGPKIVQAFMGETSSKEELGGEMIHRRNGTITRLFDSPSQCREEIDGLLSAFYETDQREREPRNPLKNHLIPMRSKAYDMHEIIDGIADKDSFREVSPDFAGNLITAFARIGGIHVGIFANQPQVLAGTLDCDTSEKGTRFLQACKKLRLPLLVIADVPSFMPGTEQEQKGIEIKGGQLLKAMIQLDTVKITLILNKSFGGAYIAMNSLGLGASKVYAWSGSSIGIMGESMSKALQKDSSPLKESLGLSAEENLANQSISGILSPEETREILVRDFSSFRNKG